MKRIEATAFALEKPDAANHLIGVGYKQGLLKAAEIARAYDYDPDSDNIDAGYWIGKAIEEEANKEE